MAHVNIKEILKDARRRKYGVANLYGGSVEQVLGQVRAAEIKKAPLILCYNHELCPSIPAEIGVPLIVKAAEYAKVPVATILDHGSELDLIIKTIHYGISGVMFDGSDLPYEENIKRTQEIVKIAHPLGVSVEAGVGQVGGSSIELGKESDIKNVMTDPDEAVDFVKRTNVDALDISFGNTHGVYKGIPMLDFERIKTIANAVDIPLVMHGGSGLDDSEYQLLIDCGISKFHFYTSIARREAMYIRDKALKADENDLITHKFMKWRIEFYTNETMKLMDLLKCSGME